MGMPGLPELIIIFFVLVLLFGSSKIPKLFGAFGEGIKNFKKGVSTKEGHVEGKDSKIEEGSEESIVGHSK